MAKKPVEKDYKVGDRVTVLANGLNDYGRCPAMEYMVGKNYVIREFPDFKDYVTLTSISMEHQDSKIRLFHYTFNKRDLKRTHKAKAVAKVAPVINKPVAPPPVVEKVVAPVIPKAAIDIETGSFTLGMKHLDHLNKKVEDKGSAGTCSYSKKCVGEAAYRDQVQDDCHARIGNYGFGGKAESLVLNIAGHIKDVDKHLDAYKLYVEYILAASPWKKCFKYYGITHALKHGVMMNLDMTIGQLAGGAVALRQGSEYAYATLPLFQEVVKLGFTGNTAWVVSSSVTGAAGKRTWNHIENGHRCMHGGQDAKEFFKFFKEGYFLDLGEKPYKESSSRYNGIARHAAKIHPGYDVGREGTIDKYLRDVVYKADNTKKKWGEESGGITEENFLKALETLDNLLNN